MNNVPHKVLLPAWIFEQAKDDKDIKCLVQEYMTRYPHYRVIKVSDSFAVCDRLDGFI